MASYIATLEGLGMDPANGLGMDPTSWGWAPVRGSEPVRVADRKLHKSAQSAPLVSGIGPNQRKLKQAINAVKKLDKQIPRAVNKRVKEALMRQRQNAAAEAIRSAIRVAAGRRAIGKRAGLADMELEAGGSLSFNTAEGLNINTQAAMDQALASGKAAASGAVEQQIKEISQEAEKVPPQQVTTRVTANLTRVKQLAKRVPQTKPGLGKFKLARIDIPRGVTISPQLAPKPQAAGAGVGLLALLALGAAVAFGS